jgi:transcriptional regulator with GAF, ATPase, and Fis domain/tetratricopeptide (TPR) repeat protein
LTRAALTGLVTVGEGASATVFRARLGDVDVACKVARTADSAPWIVAEAQVLAWLDDARLPSMVTAGPWPVPGALSGRPALVMPWVEGEPLSPARLASRDRMAAVIARDVGEALAALERVGLAHGDVKPANVLVSGKRGDRRARLVDVGLAGRADATAPSGFSPRYLGPEGAGAGVERRLLDRFALGVLLAEVLSPAAAASSSPHEAFLSQPSTDALHRVVHALLSREPHARPSARYVAAVARELLGEPPGDFGASAVRSSYVGVRRAAIEQAAAAATLDFSSEVATVLPRIARRVARARALAGEGLAGVVRMEPLDDAGRARWLGALVGPAAASWPVASLAVSEAHLADALEALATEAAPAGWTFETVRRAVSGDGPAPAAGERDVTALAIALSSPDPDEAAVVTVEAMEQRAPDALRAALVDALRRRGQPERGLLAAAGATAPVVLVAAAECARRVGDRGRAVALCDAATLGDASVSRRARAVRARVTLDGGDVDGALALATADRGDARAAEVEALALAALAAQGRGDLATAAEAAGRGLAAARDDETRARLSATLGYVAHARGDAAAASRAYGEAAASAGRAGAMADEAAYRTGEAAAAVDAGDLANGITAADRAIALAAALGRRRDAARAHLSRAAALRIAGAGVESRREAMEAEIEARLGGDARAEAFSQLVIADASPADPANTALLRRAMARLVGPEDELRGRARLLRAGALRGDEIADGDRDAQVGDRSPVARLEWWGARGERLAGGVADGGRPADVVASILPLVDGASPLAARAEAADVARRLALSIGDGSAARRLLSTLRGLAARVVAGCPPELRASLLAVPWVKAAGAPPEGKSADGAAQLADVLALVRALSGRERLRPLLDQVLDALLLWTGVERGVLLMPAPDQRLVARSARNLSRADLSGEQLSLSRTLAMRAMREQRAIVAVDAAGESADTSASVHALRLRSVLAVPLIARGDVLGVAYLDDRARRGAFGPDELAWVDLVAGIAAVAIADARDQVLLRRAARRAERQRGQLAEALAHREATLEAVERSVAPTSRTRALHAEIVGTSAAIEDSLRLVDRVGPTDVPVLILGESGSGKELFARAVHRASRRVSQRFISESCASIPEPLLESTLFGHARGAFTGAVSSRQGLFEIADRGTLFLDEIGEMSLGMQTKLLRVLQDGEVRAVGANASRNVDVRVITATHRDLRAMVAAGTFREDLYYRLRVVEIPVPALRQRPGDVPLLVAHFLEKHEGKGLRVSPSAMAALVAAPWPGNVRQLENELRRAIVLSDGVIEASHLSPDVLPSASVARGTSTSLTLRDRIDDMETVLIREALARTRGNQSKAAELLGVSRFGLQKMLKRLGIRIEA